MAKQSKQDQDPPRLIRRLRDLEKKQHQGQPPESAAAYLQHLLEDPDEVALAVLWLGESFGNAYQSMLEAEQANWLTKETLRPDLTKAEAQSLQKAVTQCEERMRSSAQRSLERKWQQRFHPR